jgi:hypothetical protein
VAIPPVDEALEAAGLSEFRERLLSAVQQRDRATIVALVDPSRIVENEPLRSVLEEVLGLPDHSYWLALERSLQLGGSFTTTRGAQTGRREFCAPYTYSRYPRPRPSGFQGETEPWVIVGSQVPVRAEPDEASQIIARLTNELVEVNGDEQPGSSPQWYGVVTSEGREGWVSSAAIRDPEDYHLCLAEIDGEWLLSDVRKGRPRS